MLTKKENYGKKTIRSFVNRKGRLTQSQKKAIENYSESYLLPNDKEKITASLTFNNHNPLVIEVGFGMGDTLIEAAIENPQKNFIGIEVYEAGIGKTLHVIQERNLKNLMLIKGDATEIIEEKFLEESVSHILIFFPDPWHKKRHHKRRLIQASFIQLLIKKLQPKGIVHIATDWEDYKNWIVEVMETVSFSFIEATEKNNLRTSKETKFERRGKKLGHKIFDLIYQKTS